MKWIHSEFFRIWNEWNEMKWMKWIIFADRQTINQVKSNSKTEATLSTVVCGSSGSGPISQKSIVSLWEFFHLMIFSVAQIKKLEIPWEYTWYCHLSKNMSSSFFIKYIWLLKVMVGMLYNALWGSFIHYWLISPTTALCTIQVARWRTKH